MQQVLVLTPAAFEVYDVNKCSLVESERFDAWSLVSPILSHTTTGALSYSDAVSEVAHSVRVYKGKIFLLVRSKLLPALLAFADLAYRDNIQYKSARC